MIGNTWVAFIFLPQVNINQKVSDVLFFPAVGALIIWNLICFFQKFFSRHDAYSNGGRILLPGIRLKIFLDNNICHFLKIFLQFVCLRNPLPLYPDGISIICSIFEVAKREFRFQFLNHILITISILNPELQSTAFIFIHQNIKNIFVACQVSPYLHILI